MFFECKIPELTDVTSPQRRTLSRDAASYPCTKPPRTLTRWGASETGALPPGAINT